MHRIRANIALLAASTLFAGCATAQDHSSPAYPIEPATADHYVWGGKNDGWYMINRRDLSIIQERMAPGGEEIRHYHRKSRQFFYVLSGTLTMDVDGDASEVTAGQGIEIVPGKTHKARNASAAPLDMLVVSMPNSHGDRVEVPEGQ
jgi:mannose-6-phosphate isomerase-like protein (cupin superfamily)